MKLIPVESLPKRRATKKDLRPIFEEFSKMDVNCVEVQGILEQYSSLRVAQSTLSKTAKKFGYPVKVHGMNGKIYFEKIE